MLFEMMSIKQLLVLFLVITTCAHMDADDSHTRTYSYTIHSTLTSLLDASMKLNTKLNPLHSFVVKTDIFNKRRKSTTPECQRIRQRGRVTNQSRRVRLFKLRRSKNEQLQIQVQQRRERVIRYVHKLMRLLVCPETAKMLETVLGYVPMCYTIACGWW